jgi:hypothetical protein
MDPALLFGRKACRWLAGVRLIDHRESSSRTDYLKVG